MKNIPPYGFFILILIVLIFILNQWANTYNWYWQYASFDNYMHVLGGVFAGSLGVYLYYFSSYVRAHHNSFIAPLLIALSTAALIGILWEFFEYGLYATIAHDTPTAELYISQGLPDTLGDLFFDLTGSVISALGYLILWRKK